MDDVPVSVQMAEIVDSYRFAVVIESDQIVLLYR